LQGAQHLARSLIGDMYFRDMVKLSRTLENARANPTIKYINLLDANGLSLLTTPEDEGVLKDHEDSFRRAMVNAGDTWIRAVRGGELDIGGPITTPGGERIGYVRIHFSFAYIADKLDIVSEDFALRDLSCPPVPRVDPIPEFQDRALKFILAPTLLKDLRRVHYSQLSASRRVGIDDGVSTI
jgi:hypothetical protein